MFWTVTKQKFKEIKTALVCSILNGKSPHRVDIWLTTTGLKADTGRSNIRT